MLRAFVVAGIVVCAGASFSASAAGAPRRKPVAKIVAVPELRVFYSGVELRFIPESPARKWRLINVGPWTIGAKVGDGKPSDKRLNFYIVAPGKQYQRPALAQYDHNLVISALPKADKQAEYDIWWALVLDPELQTDFQDEHELILAAQGRFQPPPDFNLKKTPSYTFLQKFLKFESNADLEPHLHPDGSWPRVLIVPAKLAVRAAVDSLPQPEDSADPQPPIGKPVRRPTAQRSHPCGRGAWNERSLIFQSRNSVPTALAGVTHYLAAHTVRS